MFSLRWLALATVSAGLVFQAPAGAEPAKTPPTSPPVGYRSLFNGKDLSGWEGNRDIWRVENGTIIGEAKTSLDKNQFLATTRPYQDFFLVLQFKLVGGKGNSGVQFRSERIPNHHEMIGYQADIGEKYWGCLYDESRRKKILVQAPPELEKVLRKDDWNDYGIRCMGNRIEMFVNGIRVVDYTEHEEGIPQTGLIALQTHSSPEPIRVEFKNIFIQEMPVAQASTSDATGFVIQEFKKPDGHLARYTVFVPADYHKSPDKKWPTILFLHGSGERGQDGQMQTKVGIGPAILARQESFPFLVVFPQAVDKEWDADHVDGKNALHILDDAAKTYRIDPDQLHLSGLSAGAIGSWTIAHKHPDRWATFSMVCGHGKPSYAEQIKVIPFWGFCGDKDIAKLLHSMRELTTVLKKEGADVRYTEYPDVGHNCWDLAYNTDELYQWMLGHPKKR